MSAHLEVIQPPAPVRRSPIAHWHEMHGTSFAIREAMSVPVEFGITAPQGNALQLCDVSWRRRFGCKGPHAEAALAACGIVVPPGVNRWCCDERGILVARLTTREFLIQCEGEVTVPFAAVAELFGSLQRVPGVYPVSRQDLAIEISGAGLEEFLAQVCSVDFAPVAQGHLQPLDATDQLEKPCYDYKGLARASVILDELTRHLRSVGIDVYQIDHEDANGQFEINYTYADALKSADDMIYFRMAASEIAHAHGAIVSFMPKPFANRTGSGAHFHLSIGSSKRKNEFYDDSDPRGLGLSQLGYWFLGGLLHHAPALTAICAPTVNSYKRLVVGRALSGATWAPAFIAYGDNNRTACLRIPYGRIEMRLPDGAANPYLATAAIAAAGLDGIDRKIDPGEPLNLNFYELTPDEIVHRDIKTLPQSLHEALVALEQDEVVQAGLGVELAQEFIRLKRMEWVEYSRHVSEWETRRYLEMF